MVDTVPLVRKILIRYFKIILQLPNLFAGSKRSLWLFCHITRFSKDNTQHNHVSGSESSSQGSRSGMGQ